MQSPMGSHEEREQTLNQLLAEMDGFDGRKGIIIMGATNRPEVLDPALLRPGRFDRQVLVDKPDVKGREDILRIHVKTVKIGENVDLKVVAQRTAGFAGADLANLVNEAALLAARKDKLAVDMNDFDDDAQRGDKLLDNPSANERGNHSGDTARKIDAEVKQILTAAHNEARRVLRERRDILDELSIRLLDKEVIEGDELRTLLGPVP